MTTEFKVGYTRSLRGTTEMITIEECYERVKTGEGFEMLTGRVKPYYDWDNKYDSEEEQINDKERKREISLGRVRDRFPQGTIYGFESCGDKLVEIKGIWITKWVNSFHYVVDGVGCYESGSEVPRIDGFDNSVYKGVGKQQKFRLPYCVKDRGDNRIFKRFEGEEVLTLDECKHEFPRWLVSNVEGLTLISTQLPVERKERTPQEFKNDVIYDYVDETFIDGLVCMLDDKRAEKYDDWIQVGFALKATELLYKIDLEHLFKMFSESADSYDEDVCCGKYRSLTGKEGGLGIGSLRRWAKLDNPTRYAEMMDSILNKPTVMETIAKLPEDVDRDAKVVEAYLLSNRTDEDMADYWVATEEGRNYLYFKEVLYRFNGTYWVPREKTKDISDALYNGIYYKMVARLKVMTISEKAKQETMKGLEKLRGTTVRKGMEQAIVNRITKQSGDVEGGRLFDVDDELLGFRNGVWDLTTDTFRKGRREDYISRVVPFDYGVADAKAQAELEGFLTTILPIEDEKRVMMEVLASGLSGKYLENVVILTGNGRNGKDTLISHLYQATVGKDLYYQCNVATLSDKDKGGINQDVSNKEGKRVVVYNEASCQLRCAELKKVSGCPTLNARGIYSKDTELANKATNMIICNDLPTIDKVDEALYNRLLVIPFRALFRIPDKKEELPPNTPHLHDADKKYTTQEWIKGMRLPFIHMLLQAYKTFRANGYYIKNVPQSIRDGVKDYIADADPLICWFKDNYDYVDDAKAYITVKEVYGAFKRSELWDNSSKTVKRTMNEKKMRSVIEKHPSLKQYYYERIMINKKDLRSILLKYKQKPTAFEEITTDDNGNRVDEETV